MPGMTLVIKLSPETSHRQNPLPEHQQRRDQEGEECCHAEEELRDPGGTGAAMVIYVSYPTYIQAAVFVIE